MERLNSQIYFILTIADRIQVYLMTDRSGEYTVTLSTFLLCKY
jgi:hypothetical protein